MNYMRILLLSFCFAGLLLAADTPAAPPAKPTEPPPIVKPLSELNAKEFENFQLREQLLQTQLTAVQNERTAKIKEVCEQVPQIPVAECNINWGNKVVSQVKPAAPAK